MMALIGLVSADEKGGMARMTPKRKMIGKTKILHRKTFFIVIPSLPVPGGSLDEKNFRLNLFRGTRGIPDPDSLYYIFISPPFYSPPY